MRTSSSGPHPFRALPGLALLLCLLPGCVHRSPNPPLAQPDLTHGYYFHTHQRPNNSSDTLFVLCFSGGGTRAAALSLGVLEELRRTPLARAGRTNRLLDEVDAISSVSGGSVTAAAYTLLGEEVFDQLDAAFLKRNIQRQIVGRTLNPFRWPRLWSKTFSRSDLAAELYDQVLFHGATFADLNRRPGAYTAINATDIDSGARFSFTQYQFDLLCADLGPVRVAQAVAASSAVPGLLSPITLNNYAGRCEATVADGVREAVRTRSRERDGRAWFHFAEMSSYLDSTNRPYLHLVDGGVADNLGIRAVLDGLYTIEANPPLRDRYDLRRIRNIAIVVVNAYSKPETGWSRREQPPGDLSVAVAGASIPLDRYSYETIELLKEEVERWRVGQAAVPGAVQPPPQIRAIVVGFGNLTDPEERRYFMNQPTSFRLPDEVVDRIREVGGRLLRESAEYRAFLGDLAQPTP